MPAPGTKPGNKEAARYRVRLRTAEAERDQARAERDTLAVRLLHHERREAERIATAPLAAPADLLRPLLAELDHQEDTRHD